MKCWLAVLLVANCFLYVYCASILDFLDLESRDDDATTSDEPSKNCLCNGPSCICCVDFNMSLIDLGGPGCVRMNYISPEEGIALNVSYGDNLLHSQTVKGPDPAPTCLKIFTTLAQMCAHFTELLPTDDGMRGCLKLEPMLLGEVQVELPLGCFRMGPKGMTVIESSNEVIKEQAPTEEALPEKQIEAVTSAASENAIAPGDDAEDDDDDTIGGLSTKEIIAAVNKSAEEGIALISNWLGLGVNKVVKGDTTTDVDAKTESSTATSGPLATTAASTTPVAAAPTTE